MENLEMLKGLGMALLTAFATILGWLYRDLKQKQDAQEKDMTDFKLHVAEKYVNHNDLADAMQGIKDVLGGMASNIKELKTDFVDFTNRVYDKLDKKADKASAR